VITVICDFAENGGRFFVLDKQADSVILNARKDIQLLLTEFCMIYKDDQKRQIERDSKWLE
jgi:hypothetical protein